MHRVPPLRRPPAGSGWPDPDRVRARAGWFGLDRVRVRFGIGSVRVGGLVVRSGAASRPEATPRGSGWFGSGLAARGGVVVRPPPICTFAWLFCSTQPPTPFISVRSQATGGRGRGKNGKNISRGAWNVRPGLLFVHVWLSGD
jgi:hypothetical protein